MSNFCVDNEANKNNKLHLVSSTGRQQVFRFSSNPNPPPKHTPPPEFARISIIINFQVDEPHVVSAKFIHHTTTTVENQVPFSLLRIQIGLRITLYIQYRKYTPSRRVSRSTPSRCLYGKANTFDKTRSNVYILWPTYADRHPVFGWERKCPRET